jgi:hypothetical protein
VLLLPYIVLVGHKDKTIFPIFLAAGTGMMLDAVSQNNLPVYAIAFVFTVAVSKLFFSQFTAYGEFRANAIVTLIGLLVIYSLMLPSRFAGQFDVHWLVPIGLNIFLNLLVLAIFTFIFRKYLDFLESKTEDRFR